jgi:hypothetical protein
MTETNRTYSDDHDAGYFDSAARGDSGVATQRQSSGHPGGGPSGGSTAAERLGGPSESERESASDETSAAPDQAEAAEARSGGNGAPSSGAASGGAASGDAASGGAASGGAASGGAGKAASGNGSDAAERLIARDRAESYQSRWKEIKGDFVDEPRTAVRGANELVGEVLDELEELFRGQRAEIEKGLDRDETTTEDLRLALGRYRVFFERLLSI